MAHRTDAGAAMLEQILRGDGPPTVSATPIDTRQIEHVAVRLRALAKSLRSNPGVSLSWIAGELDGMSKRLHGLIRHGMAVALVFALAWVSNAHAQQQSPILPPCLAHAELTKQLTQRYLEHPRAVALHNDGRLLEIYRTDDGSTWTVLMTRPDGWSCIVAAGRDWEDLAPVPPEQPVRFAR